MSRLPNIGTDSGNWGTVLNDYLSVSINANGTLKYGGVNVRQYGAVGDGATNDTAAIQAAIDALPASGGIVYLPAATYIVNGTLNIIDRDNIRLKGEGANHAIYGGAPTTGTILKRLSGTGTMVNFESTDAGSVEVRKGNGMEGISLLGNALATTGLRLISQVGGLWRDIAIRSCTTVNLDMNTVLLTGNYSDTQFNLLESISIRATDGAADSSIGLRMSSYATGGSNTSGNVFNQIILLNKNGVGIQLNDADSNRFHSVTVNAVGGTGYGLELNGGNGGGNYSGHARSNRFYDCEFANGIISRGTGFDAPATNNFIYINTESSVPTITIEPGSGLTVENYRGLEVTGTRYRSISEDTDEFNSGVMTSGQIGKLGWSCSSGVTKSASEIYHPGIIRLDTSASSGTLRYLCLGVDGDSWMNGWDLWNVGFLVRLNTNDSDTHARVGLLYGASGFPPVNGAYFEKLYGDTSWFAVSRNANTQTRSVLSGVTTGWVFLRSRFDGNTTVYYSINGGTEVAVATNAPAGVYMQPAIQIKNQAAAAKTIDVDYYNYSSAISR